jgi:integrase
MSSCRATNANPCGDVQIRDHGRTDETMHPLSIDDLAALFWAADEDGRRLIAVAVGTGLRQGEQRALRWEDVVLEDVPHLVVRHGSPGKPTKNGRIRKVPLFGLALAAFESMKRGRGLVWPTSEGHARWQGKIVDRDAWKAWLARAGVARPIRWHDLRHTAATLLLCGAWGAPWSTEEVRELLGHSSVAVTERYARPNGALAASAALRHREGTKAPTEADVARALAAEILESRLRDLNSRPTVYESTGDPSRFMRLDRARAFVVRLLERAATVGGVDREAVRLAGEVLDELDAVMPFREASA